MAGSDGGVSVVSDAFGDSNLTRPDGLTETVSDPSNRVTTIVWSREVVLSRVIRESSQDGVLMHASHPVAWFSLARETRQFSRLVTRAL